MSFLYASWSCSFLIKTYILVLINRVAQVQSRQKICYPLILWWEIKALSFYINQTIINYLSFEPPIIWQIFWRRLVHHRCQVSGIYSSYYKLNPVMKSIQIHWVLSLFLLNNQEIIPTKFVVMIINLQRDFHMAEGDGEHSYAKNSRVQVLF